jgi:hypothetical protein
MTPTHQATLLTEGNHDDALTLARIFLMARRTRPNNRRNSWLVATWGHYDDRRTGTRHGGAGQGEADGRREGPAQSA